MNIYIITENLKLSGKGEVYTVLDSNTFKCYTSTSEENVDKNLVINFNNLDGHYSLFENYSKEKKISVVKEIISELRSSKVYKNSETLVSDIKKTLELRNNNYRANMNRNHFILMSFK